MSTVINNSQLEIIKSTDGEINLLNELGEDYKQYSEMSEQDRSFLNTLVLRKQPMRLLELGVCSGASALIMLNAIKNIEGAHLYSIDYNTQHYKLKDKLTGFYVDNFPQLKEKWTLKTGGLALNFTEEIGGDIDFCLIDTVHANPGEILDFLMVLPYLKKDATLVFHDTNLHARVTSNFQVYKQYTNNLLMSSITGSKLIPADTPFISDYPFVNIGAVQLNENTKEHIWEIFNLLTLKWNYMLKDEELEQLSSCFSKFYGEYYADYFNRVVKYQKQIRALEQQLKSTSNNVVIKKPNFLQKIFSVRNECEHKVLRILGIKIKFKRRKGV